MSSPTLSQFIGDVEAALAALDVALQEARLLTERLDGTGIDVFESTLYDQVDSRGNFGNFQIALSFDRLRDEVN